MINSSAPCLGAQQVSLPWSDVMRDLAAAAHKRSVCVDDFVSLFTMSFLLALASTNKIDMHDWNCQPLVPLLLGTIHQSVTLIV